ncbi:arsenosugar biosynthesis radical SAM (seleno)protein ArsS [Prochlorococcus sp. MIT 1307]|uniref:arsenosugar biosynthesis radical SAM (seleno)protein ArsS n=1 Tax=Prochlorococcus sp. MIT 1307 TaxID=3096219 RepID=UPI002A7623E5|nr:arsenosugar biosynthesis radical SAM (seleno)protein ArsS [Prochlorococcus sp. MIT 1307]
MAVCTFPKLSRSQLTTLQVNLGYRCNQKCGHCHVNAGPERKEMMDKKTLELIPKVLKHYNLNILDITGGAPELHPDFKKLVIAARDLGVEVIDRCNLTILNEPGNEGLADFLAENQVTVTASMPCYQKENVDMQRGKGVFERSLMGLRQLNSLGYGKNNDSLILNLVFNPQGDNLPPPQAKLEADYREKLNERYGISFNNLYTITNMPIKRFAAQLEISGKLSNYQKLLIEKYNSSNLENVMCKTLISVDWQGLLYDCDFNQQLGLHMQGRYHIKDLLNQKLILEGESIEVGQHCYGCTAGSGSSCSGSLEAK